MKRKKVYDDIREEIKAKTPELDLKMILSTSVVEEKLPSKERNFKNEFVLKKAFSIITSFAVLIILSVIILPRVFNGSYNDTEDSTNPDSSLDPKDSFPESSNYASYAFAAIALRDIIENYHQTPLIDLSLLESSKEINFLNKYINTSFLMVNFSAEDIEIVNSSIKVVNQDLDLTESIDYYNPIYNKEILLIDNFQFLITRENSTMLCLLYTDDSTNYTINLYKTLKKVEIIIVENDVKTSEVTIEISNATIFMTDNLNSNTYHLISSKNEFIIDDKIIYTKEKIYKEKIEKKVLNIYVFQNLFLLSIKVS